MSENTNSLLRDDFLFGVATAGFQIEGGYNGNGEPSNNWAAWEHEGRVEPSGDATGFWTDPESQLDLAKAAGLNSFRMSIEWSRVEPRRGEIDHDAFARYREILIAIRSRGMEPVVTLQHFTHPSWLGPEPWRHPDSPAVLAGWMDRAVAELGDLCSNWVTINEPAVLSINSFFTGIFPPGRTFDGTALSESIDGLLTAHVLGYDLIHHRQPDAVVTTNPYTFSIYELDQIGTDLLMARHRGIDDDDVSAHLIEARREHYRRIGAGGSGWKATLEGLLRRFAASQLPVADLLPRTRAAIRASDSTRHLDIIAVDHYAPLAASHLVIPGIQTAGGRWWKPGRSLWDDAPDPDFFVTVLQEAGQYGLPVWVLENGMCNRVVRGRSYGRMDGMHRPRYLADHLGAVVEAHQSGVDVQGFWHWTLIDNYEWGSYEPRFGLYGMDRARGMAVSHTDALGDDSAGALRKIIEGIRAGDASVINRPSDH